MAFKNKKLISVIKTQALEYAPNECCGLVFEKTNARGFKLRIKPCKNISRNPDRHFYIAQEDIQEVLSQGKLLYFYHSHLKGDFSQADKYIADKLKINSLLYVVEDDEFKEYSFKNVDIPLVGRPYLSGSLDCYELVKDYYQQKLNLRIESVIHPLRNINLYDPKIKQLESVVALIRKEIKLNSALDFYKQNGFKEIQKETIKKHDIILSQDNFLPFVYHCLVYLGENQILHHRGGRISNIEPFTNFWRKEARYYLRHKKL